MTPASQAELAAAQLWLDRLADAPADDDRLAGLPEDLRAGLLASPRLRPRLADHLFGWVDPAALPARAELERPDPFILDAGPLATLAGAIWHSGSILRVIERAPRAYLLAELGASAIAAASRHRGLAPAGLPPVAADDLPDAVREAGAACLAAWAEGLDSGLAARLRHRLPMADPARPAEAARAVVRAALAEVAALG